MLHHMLSRKLFVKPRLARLLADMVLRAPDGTALPSNLQLADINALKPLPEVTFPALNYSFPTLDVPESMHVLKLHSPGEYCDKPVKLERKIFEVAIRLDIVHNMVRYTRHKRRQPKMTKRMSQIAGSNKKPRPQKGTGQSQVGHRRNSAWRGGQKAHGPVLRDYSIDINRKTRALGMMIVFNAKFREGNLVVFDSLSCNSPRTKELHQLLEGHALADHRLLFVDGEIEGNFALASRNLSYATVMPRHYINVYEVLKADKLIMSRMSFQNIQTELLAQYSYNGKRKNALKALEILARANSSKSDGVSLKAGKHTPLVSESI